MPPSPTAQPPRPFHSRRPDHWPHRCTPLIHISTSYPIALCSHWPSVRLSFVAMSVALQRKVHKVLDSRARFDKPEVAEAIQVRSHTRRGGRGAAAICRAITQRAAVAHGRGRRRCCCCHCCCCRACRCCRNRVLRRSPSRLAAPAAHLPRSPCTDISVRCWNHEACRCTAR